MRNWLKWGLIYLGIGIVVLLILNDSISINLLFGACYENSTCDFLDSIMGGTNFSATQYMVLGTIIDLLIWFGVGVLIGRIKDKSNKKKSRKK